MINKNIEQLLDQYTVKEQDPRCPQLTIRRPAWDTSTASITIGGRIIGRTRSKISAPPPREDLVKVKPRKARWQFWTPAGIFASADQAAAANGLGAHQVYYNCKNKNNREYYYVQPKED